MSTLSVNNITTQTGDTITVPSGKVFASPGLPIQTVFGQDETGLVIGSASTPLRFMNVPITTKVANSTFLIRFSSALYSQINSVNGYDTDFCAGMAFKIGTATTAATDYTAISTYSPSRQNITFSGSTNAAFTSADAFRIAGTYDAYRPLYSLYNEDTFSPNQAAGTVINVACYVKATETGRLGVGVGINGISDYGTVSTLTVTEFAP